MNQMEELLKNVKIEEKKNYLSKGELKNIKRGEVIMVDLGEDVVGSEQGNLRPCLVIQNNKGNKHSPTTIVAPITSAHGKRMVTHVDIKKHDVQRGKVYGVILCEQVRTIDKSRITQVRVAQLNNKIMKNVNFAISKSLGLC